MVAGVAQGLERQAVALKVAGSNPAARPIFFVSAPFNEVNELGEASFVFPLSVFAPLLGHEWRHERKRGNN